MTITKNYWSLYLDSKKNREPVSVCFDEKDNSVSLAVEQKLIDMLVAKNVLNGSTFLLNHDYENMSDDALRYKLLDELVYTNKLPPLSYGEYEQARNLVKFLQITAGNRLSIKTKLEVRYDPTLSRSVDNPRYNVWTSSVKEGPTFKALPNSLEYYVKLDNYYAMGRCGFLVFQDGHYVTV